MSKKIPLGQILKPHGIKGELKVLFYNEDSNSLKKDQIVFLEDSAEVFYEYKVERIFYSFRKNRIKFFDINTIEKANQLDEKLSSIYKPLYIDGNPAGIKATLNIMGICKNILRPPLVGVTEETYKNLKRFIGYYNPSFRMHTPRYLVCLLWI